MYHHLWNCLQDEISKQAPNLPLTKQPMTYFCMERYDIWNKVMGYSPDSTGHLDYLFTKSLYDRYPNLVHEKPNLELYLQK